MMLRTPQAGLTTPAVAGRGLNEGLGRNARGGLDHTSRQAELGTRTGWRQSLLSVERQLLEPKALCGGPVKWIRNLDNQRISDKTR